MFGRSTLGSLPFLHNHRRRRISSYDRTGGNADWYVIPAGETRTVAEIKGAGAIRHIWCTMLGFEEFYLRKIRLRISGMVRKPPASTCRSATFSVSGSDCARISGRCP